MSPEQIRDIALTALDDLKGLDIVTLDVRPLTQIADYMIICTGRSSRHIKSLADNVVVKAKENKITFIHREGNQDSEWVLVDLGDVVVHVMLESAREFYALEDLWEPIKEIRGQQSS